MKLPVTIDVLMEEWPKDAHIDQIDPQKSMAKIPELHAKYLRILTHHNMIVKKIQASYNERRRIKFEYYNGDLNNPEDLAKHGLEPFPKKIIRSEIGQYLDADAELNSILLKKVVHEEIVDFCKAVLKELNQRTWQLKSYMDWERFMRGQ